MRTIEMNISENQIVSDYDFTSRMSAGFISMNVDVVAESAKAVKVSRHIDSKGKDYDMWIPKKAMDRCPVDTEENGIERYMIKNWFEFDGYKAWFIQAN